MQTDTVSPTVSPAVTLPTVGDNCHVFQSSAGPVLIFSRRNLKQAIADALTDARRYALPMPQK